jgi:hypothetical protein
MNSAVTNNIIARREKLLSKSGYLFKPDDKFWKLDKDVTVSVGKVVAQLSDALVDGYVNTLTYYAVNQSSASVSLHNEAVFRFMRATNSSEFTDSALINYKAQLSTETEHYLGRLRTLLRKWYALGYYGVTDEVIEMLDGWVLKGSLKGDVIKRLDPVKGPFSDLELQAFNEKAIQAYERNEITLTELALGLVLSNTSYA